MAAPQQEKPQSRLVVISTVSFYIVAAISMVLANKWVLNETNVPLFFLMTQLLIAVVLFLLAQLVGLFKLPAKVDATLLRGLAPMVLMNVLNLSLNNFTLKYVDASFYQVARGLVLPFTVVLSSIMLHHRPSLLILVAIAIVTSGFLLGVVMDLAGGAKTTTTPIGVICGVLSSVTTALQAVVIKRSLDVVKGSALDLAWYNNLLSSFAIIPLVVLGGEVPHVMELFSGPATAFNAFVWGSLITGIFGFLICIAGFLSIKVTSPVTHMISSAVRGVFQSLFSVWAFGDIINTSRGTSIAMILVGSIYYTYIKHLESQQPSESRENLQSKMESGAAYERVSTKDADADIKKEMR